MNMGMNQGVYNNGMQDTGNQGFSNGMNNMEMEFMNAGMNNEMSEGRSSGLYRGLARGHRGNRSVSPRRGRGSNRGNVKDRLGFKSNISVDPSELTNVVDVNEEGQIVETLRTDWASSPIFRLTHPN